MDKRLLPSQMPDGWPPVCMRITKAGIIILMAAEVGKQGRADMKKARKLFGLDKGEYPWQ